MGRIGTTISGIQRALLNSLDQSNAQITLSSLRLATGNRITSPADDPAAFVRLSGLQAQFSIVQHTMNNVTAAQNLVGQAQDKLGEIHDQLDIIRTELLKDEDGSLSAEERDEAQAKIDAAVAQINTLAASEVDGRRLLDGSANYSFSGRNPNQVSALTVYSAGWPGHATREKHATLTYTGDSRYAAADATITVTGAEGTSTSISFTTADTLESIATAINAQTDDTGVVASVDDNTLTISADGPRADTTLLITVEAGTFETNEGTTKASFVPGYAGASPAISGTVLKAATQAQVVYSGDASDQITDDATFTLSGERGSTAFSVTTGESLSDVADEINQQSHTTGITASVNLVDHTLTFTSVDYGSRAMVDVDVSSGTFKVIPGNGTIYGTDAVAVINGPTYSGNTPAQPAELRHREKTGTFASDAEVDIIGALGTERITITAAQTLETVAAAVNAVSDNTGVMARVDGNDLVLFSTTTGSDAQFSISVASGTFDTVSGATSATGSDAVAGNTGVDGNRFTLNQNGLHFAMEFEPGFTGDFNTITISGEALKFNFTEDLYRSSTLAIPSVNSASLGGISGVLNDLATGGTYAGLGSNTSHALRIVDEAIGSLERTEGNVDGFYDAAITSASGVLSDVEDDLGEAIDAVNGVNVEEESTRVAYYQDLASNALAGLAFLQQQRSSIVQMIQELAGLG